MAQILVRHLDTAVVDDLKARAERNSRSLQGEIKVILEAAAAEQRRQREFLASIDRMHDHWRRQGKWFSDSAEIIRELRDEE